MFSSKKKDKNSKKYTQNDAAIKIQSLWRMYYLSKMFKKLIKKKKIK